LKRDGPEWIRRVAEDGVDIDKIASVFD